MRLHAPMRATGACAVLLETYIEHAWGGSEDGDPPLDQVYQRVRRRHRVMTLLGFGWFFGLLLMMQACGWAGMAAK